MPLQPTLDILIPLFVGAFCALVALGPPQEDPPLALVGTLAGVAQGAALYWRRSHPRAGDADRRSRAA